MRGQPLLRLILTLLLVALLGLCVWRLTGQRKDFPPPHTSTTKTPAAMTSVKIVLLASHSWEKCQVRYLDRLLIDSGTAESGKSQMVQLPLKNPTDLIINASWSNTDNHALKIQVLENDTPVFEKTLWGNQTLQDVITIPSVSA
ncbi:MAG: hypothetical protein ABI443_12245 [Chthoniobacterales bacterium]